MTKKRKVGTLLALGPNYGALLQSYATQQILVKSGYETSIITYRGSRRDILRQGLTGILFYINSHLNNEKNKKPVQKLDTIHEENRQGRIKAQKQFIKEKFANIHSFSSHKDLVRYASSLDAVLIGSDQSWLPISMISCTSSFEFVPKGVRRVSYATSLGVSKYPKYCWKQARKVWKKMDYISVREEQGKKIINEICGDIPVQVVCDPTYLFSKTEWEEFIPIERLESDKYVLCYFLGTDRKLFDVARNFARAKKLKLLSILTCEVAVEGDDSFPDRLITGASPEDFVNYIRGAEYVLTDSFHGVAFSIINEKQFFLFYPQRNYLAQSRNSRLDNVIKMWDVEDRLITDKDIRWKDIKIDEINYEEVRARVSSKRKESLEYLKKALKFDD